MRSHVPSNAMRSSLSLLLLITLACGCRYYQVQPAAPLDLDAIIAMAREEKSSEEIIRAIDTRRTVYELKTADILKLSEGGVDPAVIDYMLETHRQALEAYYRSWPHYPYGPYWYGTGLWYYCW